MHRYRPMRASPLGRELHVEPVERLTDQQVAGHKVPPDAITCFCAAAGVPLARSIAARPRAAPGVELAAQHQHGDAHARQRVDRRDLGLHQSFPQKTDVDDGGGDARLFAKTAPAFKPPQLCPN